MPSQFGQAEWILELMSSCGIERGTVFEAGAQSPSAISNSLCFLKAGWKAVLVEACTKNCEEWESQGYELAEIYNISIPYQEGALDRILRRTVGPQPLHVLFLDIDGSEYQLISSMNSYRPHMVCVEYDNAYPLSIDYVPKQMLHSVKYGQASSKAMFRMMLQKNYLYVKSFFLDHIFVSFEFAEQNSDVFTSLGTGIKSFAKNAPRSMYDFASVALHQEDGSASSGISFYKDKVEGLIRNGQIAEASIYYHMISSFFHSLKPFVLEKRGSAYFSDYLEALDQFDDHFSVMFHLV